MEIKKKFCWGCEIFTYIFKNYEGKKYCKSCWYKIKPVKEVVKVAIPIKKSFKPIKNISDNKLEELKIYRINRDNYLKENPICEFPECNSTQVELHHKAGRIGSLLTDKRNFCSLCHYHHEWCELHPIEAKELNLSKSRLNK